MWLRRIEADRLRNLTAVALDLSAGMTVLVGRNGQGKSSILEAIYLLATTRSFRTRQLGELTSWDGGPLRASGRVAARTGEQDLTVIHHDGERSCLVDGHAKDLEDYLGRLDVVDLTVERENVLRGVPDERRRFLDRGLVGLRPSFLRTLGEYRRLVGHRNALLRKLGASPGTRGLRQLEAWDERTVAAAERVHAARRRYALDLGSRLGDAGRVLFEDGEELVVRYLASPRRAAEVEPDGYADALREELVRGRGRDLGLGFTHAGPHRDDLVVELDGVDLRKFGSAGQLRAALVVLKLSKLDVLAEDRGEAPVFLMDDYDTDLDQPRARRLAEHLHVSGFQTVVATSKDALADDLGVPVRRVRVRNGEVHEMS